MSGPVLAVSRLSAGYGEANTVEDVSFTLERGEILCLVGESGCGKSTLLKALMASPEVCVHSGSAALEGTELSALPLGERRKLCCGKLGLVPQQPGSSFNPIRSYRKQFIEALKSQGKYDRASFEEQTETVFRKLELRDRERVLDSCPYALSGGMNQRMALALALLLRQESLLCDEPTSALDATVQLQVALELKRLQREQGISQIIVTHNLALARFLADRIGVMYAGRLVEYGEARSVLHAPRHPYTRSLTAAIPSLGGGLPQGLPGQPPLSGPWETGCEFMDRCPSASLGCGGRTYGLAPVGEGHYAACGGEGGRG